MKKIILCLAAVIFALSGCSGAKGNKDVVYENSIEFVNAMGLGWNLGNTFDCTGEHGDNPADYEKAWGNPETTKELIHFIKAEGFDSIRIPITWEAHLGEAPEYIIDETWMKRVKEVVDWCVKEDLFIIINIHHDGGWIEKASTDYDTAIEKYKALWLQIADKFGNYSNKLIFESMNEVGFDDLGTEKGCELLNKINNEFVELIRNSGKKNAERYLLIAGYWTDIERTIQGVVLPDDDKIILSVHYYSPSTFALASVGTSWGFANDWGTEKDYEDLERTMQKLQYYYIDNGIPVIIGEYGCLVADKKEDARINYIAAVAEYSRKYGICPVLWDDGGGMRVIDRRNLTWNTQGLAEKYSVIREEYPSVKAAE